MERHYPILFVKNCQNYKKGFTLMLFEYSIFCRFAKERKIYIETDRKIKQDYVKLGKINIP